MVDARIYMKGSKATQQGKGGANQWFLEYEPREPKRPDPLMGWAGSGDTAQQVRLVFPSLDEALAFCTRKGLTPHVVPPAKERLILRSYADNFR